MFTGAEKDWLFYQRLDELMPKPYTNAQLQILRDIFPRDSEEGFLFSFEAVDDCSEYSFEYIFEKFLLLFENDNLSWVTYLQRAEQLNPNHPETLQYLLHYAVALEDEVLIEQYSKRLEVLQE